MVHLNVTRSWSTEDRKGDVWQGSPRQGAYVLFMGMLRQQGKYLKVQFKKFLLYSAQSSVFDSVDHQD